MNDDMIKKAAQQQAVVMDQEVGGQHSQRHGESLEQHATDQQATTNSCARDFNTDLDRHSDRLGEALKEADGTDAIIEAAEQWRQDSQRGVSEAADQANRFIRDVLSQFAGGDSVERGFDSVDAAAQLAQNYALAVDERSRTLCSSIERAVEEGTSEDRLQEILGEACGDLQQMRQEFESSLENIAGARDEVPDSVNMQRVVDEVAKEGERIRQADVRAEARETKLADITEQMESGIYKPDLAMFIEDAGLDTAVELAEKWNLREVDAQIHHSQSLKEAPEMATSADNLELLTRRAHTWGAHGGDFREERNGQPADASFDTHPGFHVEPEHDALGPEDDLDHLVEIASEYGPHDAEDQVIEALDAKRDQERREAQLAEEQQRNELPEEKRLNQERAEQVRDEERRATERDHEEREERRREEDHAAEERNRARREEHEREQERQAAERARRQQDEARMDEERRKAAEQNR